MYQVFLPTFPLDKMTISELEHAATSHFRFTAVLKRAATPSGPYSKLVPYVTHVLHHRDPINPDLPLQHKAIYLVPGGRFLLMSSTTGAMTLMDLGYPPRTVIEPFAIASAHFE